MFVLKTLVPLVSLLGLAFASPITGQAESEAVRRATVASTTCGSTTYSADDVQTAVDAACSYYESGTTAGSSTYPHTYNNYEGFDFDVDGPYQEFPLVSDGPYDGGSPGADRVIINTSCEYAGAITHTGASSSSGFVGCSGTS